MLGSLCEAGSGALQNSFCMDNKGSIVGKAEVSEKKLQEHCYGF